MFKFHPTWITLLPILSITVLRKIGSIQRHIQRVLQSSWKRTFTKHYLNFMSCFCYPLCNLYYQQFFIGQCLYWNFIHYTIYELPHRVQKKSENVKRWIIVSTVTLKTCSFLKFEIILCTLSPSAQYPSKKSLQTTASLFTFTWRYGHFSLVHLLTRKNEHTGIWR